jgi:hypothetical protein
MPRRSFRYDAASKTMVEVTPCDDVFARAHAVVGEIEPFISPRDGTLIKSRAHLREYMEKNDLVHYDPTMKREEDRYAASRAERETRERLYEYVDRLVRTGRGPNQ